MVSVNHAESNSKSQPSAPPKLHWWQWDMLAWCQDGDGDNMITVTPGRPPRVVQRAHEYFRTHKQIAPLVDLGLLEYVRTEVYANGASCEIYTTSKAGKATIQAYYAQRHEKSRERDEAHEAKTTARNKAARRAMLTASLEEQFGGNYHIPLLQDMIDNSTTPFLNVPLPLIAPNGRYGLPVTVREYLICLWYECLDDDIQKKISNFVTWGEAIGFDDAAAMFTDQDDDDETDGDLSSPYGRIS